MEENTIIIGGGITGQVMSYLLRKPYVSKNIGGQLTIKEWHPGPRYFQFDKESSYLMRKLGLDRKKKSLIKIGYLDENGITEPNEEFRKRYFEKTRKNNDEPYETSMNKGKKEFVSYDIKMSELVNALSEKNKKRHIMNDVKKIDVENKKIILDNDEEIKYELLISTIPANIFYELSGLGCEELKAIDKTFIQIEGAFEALKEFDFIYDASMNEWNRITLQEEFPVLEFTGEEPDSFFPGEKDRVVIKNAQIINSNIEPPSGVMFVGRYAEWKHGFLINDAVKKALMIKKLNGEKNE